MSMTVSIRVKRLTASKVAGQNRHDLRQTIPGYVNQERTAENDIIIEPANPTALRQTCADRRAQRHCQRTLKSDAAIAMGGIITFGTEAQSIIQSLSKAEQSAMYLSIGQQLAKRLNTTLTGLVVHNDEAAPHAHFQMPGYDLSGVPLSKTVTREVTSQLQDIAGQVLTEKGLNITRGKPKAQRIEDGEDRSKIIHRSVAELHRDLPVELAAAREKLEKNRALIAKAKEDLAAETKGREEKIQKRLEAYERRAAVAKADAERLEVTIAQRQKTACQIQGEMPNLVSTKKLLSKNLTVAQEDLAEYHQQVAEYSRDKIAAEVESALMAEKARIVQREQAVHAKESRLNEQMESALMAEKARIVQREQAVHAKESQLNGQEEKLQKLQETLNTHENRLKNHDDVHAENTRLKQRLETVGTHVGNILGIENASMNRGKVLRAVESASSMTSFQKALAEQKLILGVNRRDGRGG